MKPFTLGPIMQKLEVAKSTVECLSGNKHWLERGLRSAAIAAQLILDKKIIAVATDTIYGIASLAQCDETIERLYAIKKRDFRKPLSICLWDVQCIETYAEVGHLPKGLIHNLLPGPTTILLERKMIVNPNVNAGMKNIGIRIPQYNFLLCVAKMVNQPLALTSANISKDTSTVHPNEFKHLWPELDGIFYNKPNEGQYIKCNRSGSTIVDLSVSGEFQITRKGKNYKNVEKILILFNLKKRDIEINEEEEECIKKVSESSNISNLLS